jgi:class 3 adenylate cyclase
MFADVEGFTAWSSVREPSQVFTLLETLYAAFDRVAVRRRVFKVETVGDCYVAVSGLPEPRHDHAVVMARFARDCVVEHISAVKKLENTLGPETGDLRLRVGLNSGSITAGVLRGERSRFQLFGDTVNTAARLESTGEGNRIHLSSTTAELIKDAGHERWIESREGFVTLKGKGSMQTYWLTPRKKDLAKGGKTNSQIGLINEDQTVAYGISKSHDAKKQRLISFNADALLRVIKQIVARRETPTPARTSFLAEYRTPIWKNKGTAPLAEVVEVIQLPHDNQATIHVDPNSLALDPKIIELVHEYVAFLADMYPDNPFHNFEHASHVTMSVTKLLSRIVAPSDMDFTDNAQASAKLHDHTYGITSDPLTQFACVLSALIHDVDHPGVSNATLVAEDNKLMKMYGDKSLAEQNSVDQAWDLLMTEEYHPLVAVLCRDDSELSRLRQLVVNSVMATDIMDPDLKKLRNGRWEKAFHNTNLENDDTSRKAVNRKATIVIEHLIQASDVAHTMQHWNVYTKWNARLFKEMYKAHLEGRSGAKDPSEFWAKGEIGFFDFYIIPLAKKLKDCGVFGVSSDEYLQYAISNRNEWEEKGQVMTQRLIQEVREEYGISEKEKIIT